MAKERDINYSDWTKNTARRQGVWVSYRNPNDNTYYAVKNTGSPFTNDDPMTTAQLVGDDENEYGLGDEVYNHARYGIRHITKKVLKTRYNIQKTRYRVEGRDGDQARDGINYGPGIKEFGSPEAKGLTFEFSREQNPKGKYLVCIKMTQAYVDEWIFFGNPPNPEPTEEEAEAPEDGREEFVDENGDGIEAFNRDEKRIEQKTKSSAASQIRKAFKLNEMAQHIEDAEKVLREYGKILRREGVSPEDLSGFDIAKQTRLYAKSYKKAKKLLDKNNINFEEAKFTDEDKLEFVFDSEYNLLHFLYGERPPGRVDLEKKQPAEEGDEIQNPDPASNDGNPEGTFYNAFDRRDLTPQEVTGSIPVFLPEGADPDLPPNKIAKTNNIMLDRTRNQLRGWSPATFSLLANTDKILSQVKNIGTNDLMPWTQFLSECVYPNPCIKPTEIKEKEEEPRILNSLEETTTNTSAEVTEHNNAATGDVKEKMAAKRGEEFNIIENPSINCSSDLADMIADLEDLYGVILNKFSFKDLLAGAAEKAKNEMRNQAAIFTEDVQEGIESEVKKVVDSVVKELECGVDIAKGKLEDKFLSPLKEVPGVNDLLSNFELPEMTFDLPSFEIMSFLSFIRQKVEEMAIEMIESMLISMVTEMVQDYLNCEKLISVDGIKDKGGGLFDPFSKAAFGEANLADLIPPDSVKNIAESLGIPENKIDSINNAISEVTTPEEMLTLLNGEASEEVLRRLAPVIGDTLQGIANITIEVLAAYLGRVGDNMPEAAKDKIFEAKTEAVLCNDLDYQDAADIMKDILGDRAAKEAKAAFDRNKEKLKSLCGLKEDTQDALSQAITEMPIPSKVKEAVAIAENAIRDAHLQTLKPCLDAFDGTERPTQSDDNYRLYFDEGYFAIKFGWNGDSIFRLGSWALHVTSSGENVTFRIANRGGVAELVGPQPQISYTTDLGGLSLPDTIPELTRTAINEALGHALDEDGAPIVVLNQLFTNANLNSSETVKTDIRSRFIANRNGRVLYRKQIEDVFLELHNLVIQDEGTASLKKADQDTRNRFKKIASLGYVLRSILPFVISGWRSVNRAANPGGMTPIWFPNDIITNKLVTDFLYELMFGDHGWWYRGVSQDLYEKTRNNNLAQSHIGGVVRVHGVQHRYADVVKESLPSIYQSISKINFKDRPTITPGIEEHYDNQVFTGTIDEDEAVAKKVISLLLNLLLPYPGDGVEDRISMTQESWMGPTIADKGIQGLDLKVQFPVQALVALIAIKEFYDNNGWRQTTYAAKTRTDPHEVTDINFRNYEKSLSLIVQKIFEDDETELPRL